MIGLFKPNGIVDLNRWENKSAYMSLTGASAKAVLSNNSNTVK